MAPIDRSLFHSRQFMLPPRPSKGPPGGAKPVYSFINLKSFVTLFIASFCIFVLAVLFWKIGAILRAFSRARVLGGGKEAAARYAKTWHGWVPLAKHNARQMARRKKVNKFREMMAWRSSHADYSWVWWDPGGRKLNEHVQNQRRVPAWLLSYTFNGQDTFQGPPTLRSRPRLSNSGLKTQVLEKPRNAQRSNSQINISTQGGSTARRNIGNMGNKWKRPAVPRFFWPLDYTMPTSLAPSWWVNVCTGGRHMIPNKEIENEKPQGLPNTPTHTRGNFTQNDKRGRSKSLDFDHGMRRLTQESIVLTPRRAASEGQQNEIDPPRFLPPSTQLRRARERLTQSSLFSDGALPELPPEKTRSWRYKAWGARMQRNAFEDTPTFLRGHAGRPGTPALMSMMSFGSGSEFSRPITRKIRQSRSTESVNGPVSEPGSQGYTTPRVIFDNIQDTEAPGMRNRHERYVIPPKVNSFPRRQSHRSDQASSFRPQQVASNDTLGSRSIRRRSAQIRSGHRVAKRRPHFRRHLSNPEVRLIDDLDRKLEWLSSELDPGRKHFPFLLLHNHWLNRGTWVVLDPASRVDSKTRMLYGDPRVNHPFPEYNGKIAKRKYPPVRRTKAHTPRLDSWRLAVNGARKTSGTREFLKTVELFDSSCDDSAGRGIDPSSWILRKPPQGHAMTSVQKNAYFEGCGGWYEKLEDWKHVPRAYRARKVVFEGKANRRRVVELARAVSGTCRKTARRITPSRVSHKQDEKGVDKHDRSGRGSIPRRFRLRYTVQSSSARETPTNFEDASQGGCHGVCSQIEPRYDSEERDIG